MVSSNPVAFFSIHASSGPICLTDFCLNLSWFMDNAMWNFPKGNEILGLDKTETFESWTKITSKMFVSLWLGHLHTHTGFCAEISVCPYSPPLLLETGRTFIAYVLIPLLKVWTFGLLSGPYHTALYGDWLHCTATLYRVEQGTSRYIPVMKRGSLQW